MSNKILSGLVILSVDAELAQEFNLEDLAEGFVTRNARKVNFKFNSDIRFVIFTKSNVFAIYYFELFIGRTSNKMCTHSAALNVQ